MDAGEICERISSIIPIYIEKEVVQKFFEAPLSFILPMGKTYQENKIYYHLMYRFEKLKAPPVKDSI